MVDIKGLNKAEVLASLYNNAKPQFDQKPMSVDEAEEVLKETTDFDYLKGRVMKVNLSSDDGFEEWLYDRDNGYGAAQRAIDALRVRKQIIQRKHGCFTITRLQ